MNQEKNDSIQCSIHNCVHHAENVDYCTLDRIHVGTHELNPTKRNVPTVIPSSARCSPV